MSTSIKILVEQKLFTIKTICIIKRNKQLSFLCPPDQDRGHFVCVQTVIFSFRNSLVLSETLTLLITIQP